MIEKNNMKAIYYDVLYLAACGVNGITPSQKCVESYIENEEMMRLLFRFCRSHFIEALVGMTLQKAEVLIPKEWSQLVSKAVRKVILFDVERTKICSYMEKRGIWHLTLKGIILKDFYPVVGMRQMSDNDILIDENYAQEMKDYMQSQGYKVESFGFGNHDVYEKEPVYAFEFHRSLFNTLYSVVWDEYYRKIKDKLILDEGVSYGYHMRDEDFYIYIICHAYKHYKGGGTGIRSLIDFYVYLQKKESVLDFEYIEKECEKLKIADFEKANRILCKKVFAQDICKSTNDKSDSLSYDMDGFWKSLTQTEQEMLMYYLSSGVYGTFENIVDNKMKKYKKSDGKISKGRYVFRRIFPDMDTYRLYFPFFYKHKWLLPVGWFYRIIRMLFVGKRRKKMMKEVRIVKKNS